MGYLSIENLYKNQTILLFKECYAMEKIHGTSAHIAWSADDKTIRFFSGGAKHETFIKIFDEQLLKDKFNELFPISSVVVYGECYGGKQQGMSNTYGKEMKFIVFDVKIDKYWLNVPNANDVSKSLGLEFVDYVKISTDLKDIDFERDKDSVQAIRNGCGEGKLREGVILRPLVELTLNNGERVISKHKRDEFKETSTVRDVNISPEQMKVLEDAKAIAEEWVTEMRLLHVLDKLPQGINVESTKMVIQAMTADVYKEAKGEIIESKLVEKYIGSRTAMLFQRKIKQDLVKNNS
jgi:hypothetical protein